MTAQEIFDKVCAHLAQQKRPARVSNPLGGSLCEYHTSDGLMCAVGCLFDDREREEYGTIRGPLSSVVDAAQIRGDEAALKWLTEHKVLLRDLQRRHDVPAQTTGALRTGLYAVARTHTLDDAAVDQITEWAA